jgi:glycosyltransferase involved in cell wall biosynthesis
MMNHPVEILLSTFNGEKHLQEQLDSLIAQDYTEWKLLVRDDGSTDSTVHIIEEYKKRYHDKIRLLTDGKGNLGFSQSFMELLKASTGKYVMYCDQDDSWNPHKISRLLSAVSEQETITPDKAQLVFADLQMADREMKVTIGSFLKNIGYTQNCGAQVFFLRNYVPGCNMIFNRKLIEQAKQTDNIIGLHDHWLTMVCAAVGKLTCINQPLMKYRLHDNNAIGFFEYGNSGFKDFLLCIKECAKYGFNNKKYRDRIYSAQQNQVKNICNSLGGIVSKEAIRFANIDESGYVARKWRNIVTPFKLEGSILKQLTYIICF